MEDSKGLKLLEQKETTAILKEIFCDALSLGKNYKSADAGYQSVWDISRFLIERKCIGFVFSCLTIIFEKKLHDADWHCLNVHLKK